MLRLLKPLTAREESIQGILDEAQNWMMHWDKLPDATWNPTADNTKTTFATLYDETFAMCQTYRQAFANERDEREKYYLMLGHLWEDCVEWYMDACLVLPEGTPDGELVRAILKRKAPPEADDDTSETGPGGADVGDGLPPK